MSDAAADLEAKRIEELVRSARFSHFSDDEISRIVSVAHHLTVPEGWALMVEKTGADKAYLILKGEVSVRRQGEEVGRAGAGELIGEMRWSTTSCARPRWSPRLPGGAALHQRQRRRTAEDDSALRRRAIRDGRGARRISPDRRARRQNGRFRARSATVRVSLSNTGPLDGDHSRADELDRLHALVDISVDDPLAPFALRPEKQHVFSPDGRAAVAYRIRFGLAVVGGDPVGDPLSWAAAINEFVATIWPPAARSPCWEQAKGPEVYGTATA